jgi:hypothetical protein
MLKYRLLILLYFFSFFYLAKLTIFSPVYVMSPILCTLIFFLIPIGKHKLSPSGGVLIIFCVFLFSSLVLTDNYSSYVNLILGILVFLITYTTITNMKNMNESILINGIMIGSWVVLFLISLDTIWRFSHPGAPTEGIESALIRQGLMFYLYKYNTVMFADSNTVALLLQSIFFLHVYFYTIGYKQKYIMFFCFLLLLLTFSRAAVISTIICFVFIRYKLFYFKFVALAIVVALTALIMFFLTGLDYQGVLDGSVRAKIDILYLLVEFIENSDFLRFLYGVGTGGSMSELGIYGHISFVTSIVEIGFLGSAIYLMFFITSVFYSRGGSLIVIVPITITSLSYVFYLGAPFLFISVAIIEAIESNRRHCSEYVRKGLIAL